jgi:MinD-like ATPase involved in chromosome partitioning or flagellar assembly
MKRIIIIGEDTSLKREYQRFDPESECTLCKATEAPRTKEIDILIISDREVQPLMLSEFIQNFKAKQIFYLISNNPKNTIIENKVALCKQHGIKAVLPGQTTTQIIQRVLGIAGKSRGLRNVCAILGTHPQVGVTTVALNLAKKLAESGEHTIGVLGLNQYNPGLVFINNYAGNTLDEMYAEIVDNHQSIKPGEIVNFMHHDDESKFYFLAGNQDFSKRGYFKSEEIEQVITAAAEQFDIVILDAGFSPCNNITLQALLNAEVKLLVGNQQPVSANMWRQMNNDILRLLGITADEFLLVVNRYNLDLSVDTNSLQNQMGVPVIEAIPDFGVEGIVCEIERRMLCDSHNKRIKKKANEHFEALSDIVIERFVGNQGSTKEKRGIWNKLLS